jgi:hypothetical protein
VSPDGRCAVSAPRDDMLKVWNLESGAVLSVFTFDASAHCCVLASARSIVAGEHDGRVHLLELMGKSCASTS